MNNSNLIMQLSKFLISKIAPKELIYFDDLFEFIKDDIGLDHLLTLDKENNQSNPQSNLGFYNNDAFLTSTDLIKIGVYISKQSFQNDSIRTKEELREIIDSSIQELSYPKWLHNKVLQCLEEIFQITSKKSSDSIDIEPNISKLQVNDLSLRSETIKTKAKYIVYENWNNPKLIYKTEDLNKYYDQKETYDIFIDFSNQPPELFHFHQLVDLEDLELKPLALIIEILKKAHENEISTPFLFNTTTRDTQNIKKFSKDKKQRNLVQTLSKANIVFGSSMSYKWGKIKHDQFKLILIREFNYCLIESINSNPDRGLN